MHITSAESARTRLKTIIAIDRYEHGYPGMPLYANLGMYECIYVMEYILLMRFMRKQAKLQ